MLRDLIRQISNLGKNVSLIDERGEIASVCDGKAMLDVGIRTDVMSFCPKHLGINLVTRSMAPNIIATDEIGSIEDIRAIKEASLTGVNLIFTMHGKDIDDLKKNKEVIKLLDDGYFDIIVFLSNKRGAGTVEKIYTDIHLRKREGEKNVCF